ncbi:hypothetical protein HAX54_004100, partial [Datura stramonium]|nr:hypothetical protein [Datura stramonium]
MADQGRPFNLPLWKGLTKEQGTEALQRAERARQNWQARRDDIYGEHIDLDEVGFIGAIVPHQLPANAKFDITNTMI